VRICIRCSYYIPLYNTHNCRKVVRFFSLPFRFFCHIPCSITVIILYYSRRHHVVVPQLVTSSVGVHPVGRRLRGAHLGRAVRIFASSSQHTADGQDAKGRRQGEVQSHVLGHQSGQLCVPGPVALPIGPAVPLLKSYCIYYYNI
jgi:hypothetical protein